jgi:S-layer homology domain
MDGKHALTRLIRAGARASFLTLLAVAGLSSGGCGCKLLPWALAVDPSLTGNSDANGVLEPGETVVVEPSWRQQITRTCHFDGKSKIVCTGTEEFLCNKELAESGTAVTLTGPATGQYILGDSAASYGTIPTSSTKQCADCYGVFVSAPTGRPSTHWDATFTEKMSGSFSKSNAWTLHVGGSFTDVPRSHPFYTKIETLLHNNITSGCTADSYCPDALLSRSQIAIFLAKAVAKGAANIPNSGTTRNGASYSCTFGGTSFFVDVAPTDPFCKHVHYLAAQNVISACGTSRYCPNDLLSRLEMSAFVARAMEAPGGDSAVPESYGPDPSTGRSYDCTSASPNLHFADVTDSDSLCKYPHFLWARGIVAGCGPNEYCPQGDVARDQMAKFVVNAFGLKLYEP